jgi:hypothetical protein
MRVTESKLAEIFGLTKNEVAGLYAAKVIEPEERIGNCKVYSLENTARAIVDHTRTDTRIYRNAKKFLDLRQEAA